MSALGERCKDGVRVGLFFAAVFGAYVTVMYIFTAGATLEPRGLTLPVVLGIYLVGGVGGGLIYGVVAPIGTYLLGAFVVGSLVSMPLAVAVATVHPTADLDLGEPVTWARLAVACALLGGTIGVVIWRKENK
jgi:hypothetical protein